MIITFLYTFNVFMLLSNCTLQYLSKFLYPANLCVVCVSLQGYIFQFRILLCGNVFICIYVRRVCYDDPNPGMNGLCKSGKSNICLFSTWILMCQANSILNCVSECE